MSWVHALYDTYERCAGIAGLQSEGQDDVLLPVGLTIINTHVVVHLDSNGVFLGAKLQPERIIAPCTEGSAGRTGTTVAPHPLFDSLQYLAGDYARYVGKKYAKYYVGYIDQLARWCEMPNPHPMVLAILAYLKKGSLIEDLVAQRILHLRPDGKLLERWMQEGTPLSSALKDVKPSKAYVRFTVDSSGVENRAWMEEDVRNSFMSYLSRQNQEKPALCYVSGLETACVKNHPKSITKSSRAKLISANDEAGFTYRGRFQNARQAMSIGYAASQRVHNTLRWLVESRGLYCGSQVVIAWALSGKKLPTPISDTDELLGPSEDKTASDKMITAKADSGHDYARRLTHALLSIRCERLEDHEDVSVMVLDNATTGRLSITYYRELKAGEYLERVVGWHKTCVWRHGYKKGRSFIGAPSFHDIAAAAYGPIAQKDKERKLLKSTVERLLPCIFDSAKLPADLVGAAVNRASNPVAFENRWAWEKTLGIACALYKKQHEKEAYLVALDEQRHDRDYLYGRLLAVADWIEEKVLWEQSGGKPDRPTNAMRYMNAFVQRPFHIWAIIEQQLSPYEMKLDLKDRQYKKIISKIMAQFQDGDFEKADRLSGAYLLGYHCQRQHFFDINEEAKKTKVKAKEDKDNESNEQN